MKKNLSIRLIILVLICVMVIPFLVVGCSDRNPSTENPTDTSQGTTGGEKPSGGSDDAPETGGGNGSDDVTEEGSTGNGGDSDADDNDYDFDIENGSGGIELPDLEF